MSKKSAVCTVNDLTQVEHIVTRAHASGFVYGEISVIFPDNEGTRGRNGPEAFHDRVDSGSPLRLLAGFGALAIPGLGTFFAAGALREALKTAALGGLTGALVGAGIQASEAGIYQGRVSRGHFLVAIHSDEMEGIDRAKAILDDCGAGFISTVTDSGTTRYGGWTDEAFTPLPETELGGRWGNEAKAKGGVL